MEKTKTATYLIWPTERGWVLARLPQNPRREGILVGIYVSRRDARKARSEAIAWRSKPAASRRRAADAKTFAFLYAVKRAERERPDVVSRQREAVAAKAAADMERAFARGVMRGLRAGWAAGLPAPVPTN